MKFLKAGDLKFKYGPGGRYTNTKFCLEYEIPLEYSENFVKNDLYSASIESKEYLFVVKEKRLEGDKLIIAFVPAGYWVGHFNKKCDVTEAYKLTNFKKITDPQAIENINTASAWT